jgi:hypothetical protein
MKTQQTTKFGAVRAATLGLACLACLFALGSPSVASGGGKDEPHYVLTTLDVPTTVLISPGVGTSAFGINNLGQIVGNYPKADPGAVTAFGDSVVLDGFLYDKGAFVDVTVPVSLITGLEKINDHGTATGQTWDNNDDQTPVNDFVRHPDGTTDFLPPVMPGAVFFGGYVVGINNQDTIVGTFTVNATLPSFGTQGFILEHDTYTVFNYPGATATWLGAINDSGTIAGTWFDSQGNYHGFLRHKDGSLAPVEVPGAGAGGEAPFGLNNKGDVVGAYLDSGSNIHGFVLSDGVYTTLDFPQDGGLTVALDINDERVIVGTYGPGWEQGFIATPLRGRD